MSLTAVLDVGKTNVKVLVFDGERIVWRRTAPNRVRFEPPYPHVDTEAIWRFCIDGLRDAAAMHRIDTLAVTTHGASITLLGESELAAPIMDYEFAGPDDLAADYAAVRPPFGETLTPLMADGLNWAKQVFYVQKRHPDLFAEVRHILTYPQYWGWRLTGVARNEVTSLGCHGDAWNPSTGQPSSLVNRLGWTRLMPPLLPAWAVLGPLKQEIVKATGLPMDIRVLTGVHDSNASLVPYLLTLPTPFTVISTGTWVVLVCVGASVDVVTEANGTMANVDVLGRPGPVARFMGGREYAVLTEGASSDADEADLAAMLASGALALPSFAPQASPIRTQGRIDGRLPDRPGARAALAALYEALMVDHQLDALGAATGPLVIDGSFATNALFCGVLAILRDRQDILVDSDIAGAAYGTSLLAQWPSAPDRAPLRSVPPYPDRHGVLAHKERWRAAIGP